MTIKSKQTSCRQCGTCCRKGGAALHSEDLSLIEQGLIPLRDLITIRLGEFAHNPLRSKISPTQVEIVKLRGTGSDWCCCYFDPATKGCTIYENRPLACGTLKCWEPEESIKLVGKDLLIRQTILGDNRKLQALVLEYEEECPLPDCSRFMESLVGDPQEELAILEKYVNRDLRFRNRVVVLSHTVLQEEMFLFGRPLFQVLLPFGVESVQSGEGLSLRLGKH